MSILAYIRRILAIYAAGDKDHLSVALFRDLGSEPDDEAVEAIIGGVEESALAVAELLAGARMRMGETVSLESEESLIGLVGKQIRLLGELLSKRVPDGIIDVSIPTKSDLIEIGIIHLVLARLESGK